MVQLKIVKLPTDKPAGWDVADAILTDGWSLPQCIQFIKQFAVEPTDIKPVKQKTPAAAAPPTGFAQSTSTTGPLLPFKPIGYNGDFCYYLPSGTRQVKAIKTEMHGAGTLLSLAPLAYWEHAYTGQQGVQWKLAADTCIRLSEKTGVYDPLRLRGRGAWYDDDRSVLHLGDRLLVDGQHTNIEAIKSEYIYEAGPQLEYEHAAPATRYEAHRLREILNMLFWERPIYSTLLAGWVVIAPICGALRHRPHIWITGSKGTGKTHVLENIIRKTLGNFCVPVQSETTSAGIRQLLNSDAIPVMIDEFEGDDFSGQERVQRILELARQAFSDTAAKIVKGGQSGKPTLYNIRSCFLMSSIAVNITKAADASRIIVLSLAKPHDTEATDTTPGRSKEQHFADLCKLTAEVITDRWAAAFRSRAIAMVPIIRKNSAIFGRAVAEKIGTQRAGDQIGPLLAGAYSLSSDGLITIERAREYVNSQDWSDQAESQSESDEQKCLSHIMQGLVRLPHEEISVAELIEDYRTSLVVNTTDATIPIKEDYDAALRRVGIRYDHDEALIYISDSHQGIKRLLHGTSWEKSWARLLKRIPDSTTKNSDRFYGTRTRSTGVPWDHVFGN